MSSLSSLPAEVLDVITRNVESLGSLIALSSTCKTLRQFILTNQTLWRERFAKDFPDIEVKG